MANVCVSMMAKTYQDFLIELKALATKDFSWIEWRIDACIQLNTSQLNQIGKKLKLEYSDKNIIATYRGVQTLAKLKNVTRIYAYLLKKKYVSYVDIEFKNTKAVLYAMFFLKKYQSNIILSYHNYKNIPTITKCNELFSNMHYDVVDIIKIAVTPTSFTAFKHFLYWIHEKYTKKECWILAMGKYGILSRIYPSYFQSSIIFSYARIQTASGQLSMQKINDLKKLNQLDSRNKYLDFLLERKKYMSEYFDEEIKTYNEEQAIQEAKRCLNCKHKPCVNGCPIKQQIPEFIHEIANRNFSLAANIIFSNSVMPEICSRVCYHEKQCQKHCVRGIKGSAVSIGNLERFAAQFYEGKNIQSNIYKQKVAIIGGGVAGLSCAQKLLEYGYHVDILEANDELGGVLRYGIPTYRLPKEVVQNKINQLINKGLHAKTNICFGIDCQLQDLQQCYDAIMISCGCSQSKLLPMFEASIKGVYDALTFLKQLHQDQEVLLKNQYRRILVIGGGNVAMDAARCAKRLFQTEVSVLYRKQRENMVARDEEVEATIKEGVTFQFQIHPYQLKTDSFGNLLGLYVKNYSSDMDSKEIQFIAADCILVAIGSKLSNDVLSATELVNKHEEERFIVNSQFQTNLTNVFACGDCVNGPQTVVSAMRDGMDAANAIHCYFKNL